MTNLKYIVSSCPPAESRRNAHIREYVLFKGMNMEICLSEYGHCIRAIRLDTQDPSNSGGVIVGAFTTTGTDNDEPKEWIVRRDIGEWTMSLTNIAIGIGSFSVSMEVPEDKGTGENIMEQIKGMAQIPRSEKRFGMVREVPDETTGEQKTMSAITVYRAIPEMGFGGSLSIMSAHRVPDETGSSVIVFTEEVIRFRDTDSFVEHAQEAST